MNINLIFYTPVSHSLVNLILINRMGLKFIQFASLWKDKIDMVVIRENRMTILIRILCVDKYAKHIRELLTIAIVTGSEIIKYSARDYLLTLTSKENLDGKVAVEGD